MHLIATHISFSVRLQDCKHSDVMCLEKTIAAIYIVLHTEQPLESPIPILVSYEAKGCSNVRNKH